MDRELPDALAEAHRSGFDRRDGRGVEFEPYPAFLSAADTATWWRAWTGDPSVDGAGFRVFGQDATGGMAAFWLVRAGEPVAAQPVVFLGSEGDVAVVARDLGSYLWVLAAGFGPLEAAMHPDHESEPIMDERLVALARRVAPSASGEVAELLAAARAEFPDIAEAVLH